LRVSSTLSQILTELRHELVRIMGDQLETVFLFGSQARGEARVDSDIDVLVVVRGDFDYGDLIERTSAVVSALSLQHDAVISRAFISKERFEQEQSPFLLNVRREGVIV
jgi:predicted nucleotidyltransferase